ncbi:hypothetical protein GCM10025860_18350 [Methanobacterium ferruginis]|nr:hypothetical protein GCM10025860_18350 [Methanobacterium ferruginis]
MYEFSPVLVKGVENIKKFKYTLFVLIIIICVVIGVIYGFNLQNDSPTTCNSTLEAVNVLIYRGEGSTTDSVEGIIYCLKQAEKDNLNIQFNYTTTDVINSKTLANQDVLVISGGDIRLIFNNPDINPDDIKKFVEEGKGYLGICAGAYVASNYNGEYGSGWGIAPNIECNYASIDDMQPLTLTNYGINTLKYSEGTINPCAFVINDTETITLLSFPLINSPRLYKNGNYTPIAIYTENDTIMSGSAAILDDTYGSGRIILSGPHPELNPAKPGLVARMVLWASKRI